MSCVICKEKFIPMSKELSDGKICKSCLKKIPYAFVDSEYPLYKISTKEINELISWKENKEKIYRNSFFKTSGYGRLQLDSLHGYIALCDKDELDDGSFYDDRGTVFDLTRIKRISFDMMVDRATETKIDVIVTVSISSYDLPVELLNIPVKEDQASVIMNDGGMVKYTLPSGAQMIQSEIYRINKELVEDAELRMKHELVEGIDFAKAMGLFMVDEKYTEDEIKQTRKKLLKVFHPDEGERNGIYAQKIGEAYDILINHLKGE